MATQMPSSVFTQGGSLAAYLLKNRTLITAVNNIANVNTTQNISIHNKTTMAPTTTVNNEDTRVFSVILVIMYIPFLFVAAIGNITVIVVRMKKFMQHGLSAYKQLICHLSIADIIYAAAIPLDIYQRVNNKHWIENNTVCKVLTTTLSASLTASLSILTLMAFERYQGISNPLAHRWSTKKVPRFYISVSTIRNLTVTLRSPFTKSMLVN